MAQTPYPKPGPVGGRLIREVIAFLRSRGMGLPLDSHILIADSGGSDSHALAHLLTHYGRRIVPRERITLLHVNHGWRGAESDADARFVKARARDWGVGHQVVRLKSGAPPAETQKSAEPLQLSLPQLGAGQPKGESWENLARLARHEVFHREALQRQAWVMTAHQADDLAETMLWRLFTGGASTHGGGIEFRSEEQIRPLLTVTKSMLRAYLVEEGEEWREDRTNHEGRFLRSRMRQELLPVIEKIFPQAKNHLVKLALEAQGRDLAARSLSQNHEEVLGPAQLFSIAGVRVRRSHWQSLSGRVRISGWTGEFHLPGGWKLRREKPQGNKSERWVLEK